MILNGIDYGRVWCASGARGFHAEGYWFHRPLRPLGLDWRGSTFVAKTCTLEPRAGNMPLDGTTPREWKPRCITVNFRRGVVLNAVGLSNPGLNWLLREGRWFERTEPFVLSVAATGVSSSPRLNEIDAIASALMHVRSMFHAPFALEVNVSCPNTGHDPAALVAEVASWLDLFHANLPNVPLLPKINVLVPVEAARELASHPGCAGIVVSNTIPWGCQVEGVGPGDDRWIDWKGLFGEVSPLAHLGGGGLSGAPLLPIVADWVNRARRSDFPVPIVVGGGILLADDAGYLFSMGAAAVELGSVAILRPWRVRGIIQAITRIQ